MTLKVLYKRYKNMFSSEVIFIHIIINRSCSCSIHQEKYLSWFFTLLFKCFIITDFLFIFAQGLILQAFPILKKKL